MQERAWMQSAFPSKVSISGVNSPFKFFGLFCLVRGIFPPQFTGASLGKEDYSVGPWEEPTTGPLSGYIYRKKTRSQNQLNMSLHRSMRRCAGHLQRVESCDHTRQRSGSPGQSRWWSLVLKQVPRLDCFISALSLGCCVIMCSAARPTVSGRRCEYFQPISI